MVSFRKSLLSLKEAADEKIGKVKKSGKTTATRRAARAGSKNRVAKELESLMQANALEMNLNKHKAANGVARKLGHLLRAKQPAPRVGSDIAHLITQHLDKDAMISVSGAFSSGLSAETYEDFLGSLAKNIGICDKPQHQSWSQYLTRLATKSASDNAAHRKDYVLVNLLRKTLQPAERHRVVAEFGSDLDVMRLVARSAPYMLNFVEDQISDAVKDDDQFAHALCWSQGQVSILSERLRNLPEVAMLGLSRDYRFATAEENLNDPRIVGPALDATLYPSLLFERSGPAVREDLRLFAQAYRRAATRPTTHPEHQTQFIPQQQLVHLFEPFSPEHRDFVLRLIEKGPYVAENLSPQLFNDPEFRRELVQRNVQSLYVFREESADKEFVLQLMQKNPNEWWSGHLDRMNTPLRNDKDFALKAVALAPEAILSLNPVLQRDKQVVRAAYRAGLSVDTAFLLRPKDWRYWLGAASL